MKTSTKTHPLNLLGASIALLLIQPVGAGASTISGTSTGSGGGGLNVLNSSFTANTLYYNETFGPSYGLGSAVFSLVSGSATDYAVTLDVKNTGLLAWSGYTLYCGAGTLDAPSHINAFTFDTGVPPTILGGGASATWASSDSNYIVWSGLNVPANGSITLGFNLDLNTTGSGGWQIQQRPNVVPEPSAAVLSLMSLGLCGFTRLR